MSESGGDGWTVTSSESPSGPAKDIVDDLTALESPDPDPELLPELSVAHSFALHRHTASHLARAVLKMDDSVDKLQEQMRSEMLAWEREIEKAESRVKTCRLILRDWMLRTGTTQIKTPFLTASITRGRTKKVIPDEAAFLAKCKEVGYVKAIKIIEKLVKAEADIIADTMPEKFAGLYTEETGEPGLTIRKRG